MALNDALPLLDGEIVLIVDADGRPQPDVLRWMVPHFVKVPRVAAVTGNPRVVNTTTLLAKLQAIEFTATVSVLRRAQATWGRLMTFSGICTALRKSAIEDVGRFRVGMATEDIALAWQLQTAFSDVRYEPRALFAMQVPETLPAWWSQRTRWARGLAQVLRANAGILRDVRARRMWPVWIEGLLSTVWSHLFFLAAAFWALALATGVYGFAGDPIPNFWGLLIASVLVLQISIGLSLDGRYDHSVRRYALWIPNASPRNLCQTKVLECRKWACGSHARQPSIGSPRRASAMSLPTAACVSTRPLHRRTPRCSTTGLSVSETMPTAGRSR